MEPGRFLSAVRFEVFDIAAAVLAVLPAVIAVTDGFVVCDNNHCPVVPQVALLVYCCTQGVVPAY